jgi:hypothetical protein
MFQRNAQVLEGFVRHLGVHLPGFQGLKRPHQVSLAKMIFDSGDWRLNHNRYEGYSSFGCRELEQWFGRGQFNRINSELAIFERTVSFHFRPNYGQPSTYGYKLGFEVEAIKQAYLASFDGGLSHLLRMDAKIIRSIPAAIASLDSNGLPDKIWRGFDLVASVPVNLDALSQLESLLVTALSLGNEREARKALNFELEATRKLRHLAGTYLTGPGCILHLYRVAQSGRLYAQNGLSLQTAPRRVRSFALDGLIDYDMEACHHNIFIQLASQCGYQAKAVEAYVRDKVDVRRELAQRIEISVDDAKFVLLAVLYGAKTSVGRVLSNGHLENSIPERLGVERSEALFGDKTFAAIAGDIRAGRLAILNAWPRRRGGIVNHVGKSLSITGSSDEQKLAHLCQGIEAGALRAVIEHETDSVQLLMHDGFVSSKAIDMAAAEHRILARTGHRLRLVEKEISSYDYLPKLKSAYSPESIVLQ